jgi:hypothetical protein
MPYRGEMPLGACAAHSLTPAMARCTDCAVPICDSCTSFVRTAPRCVACANAVELRAADLRAIVLYVAAIGVLFLLLFVVDSVVGFVAHDCLFPYATGSRPSWCTRFELLIELLPTVDLFIIAVAAAVMGAWVSRGACGPRRRAW